MCLAQGPQHSDAGEARTRKQVLYGVYFFLNYLINISYSVYKNDIHDNYTVNIQRIRMKA